MTKFIYLFFIFTVSILYATNDFFSYCEKISKNNTNNSFAVKGNSDWLFAAAEIKHLAKGKFWNNENDMEKISLFSEFANPLPAIIDFNKQLKTLGIDLLIVPVPAKSIIYPEKLSDNFLNSSMNRFDSQLLKFFNVLKENEINFLDLASEMIKTKSQNNQLYCKSDTHWTPKGAKVAANKIAEYIRKSDWFENLSNEYKCVPKSIEITGDLANSISDYKFGSEKIDLLKILGPTIDSSSQILLLTDSHGLVFHSGNEMFAQNCGLPDLLAQIIKRPVDLIAVKGSAATATRVNLYRKSKKNNYIDNKKIVIWVFSVREFSESDGWRIVPVKPTTK